MIDHLLQYVRRNGVTAVLLCGLLTALVVNLQQARWVIHPSTWVTALLCGLITAFLLVRSRFPDGWAGMYSLLLSTAVGAQMVGRLLPSPALLAVSTPLQALDFIHMRLTNFGLRVADWMQDAQAGQAPTDSGLWAFLTILMVWNAAVWLLWFSLRKKQTLPGLLPFTLILAFNSHHAHLPPGSLLTFIGFGLLLTACTTLTGRNRDWERQQIDYPDDLGYDWAAHAVILVSLILLLARGAPFIGTAEGRRVISDLLRPPAEQTPAQQARISQPTLPPVSGLPITLINLTQIDAPPVQSAEIAFWVRTDDPVPPPQTVSDYRPPAHYWRSRIYAEYNGQGWLPLEETSHFSPPINPALASFGHTVLRQEYVLQRPAGEQLFAANQPVQISSGGIVQVGDAYTSLVRGRAAQYQVISWVPTRDARLLSTAGNDYPAGIRETYLQLPDALPQRIYQLAAQITRGAETPYEKALRIQQYLRANYSYQLDPPPVPAGRDSVDFFLFDSPTGFCSHFSSAMVVLLRTQGIPARVSSGFTTGIYDYTQNRYAVAINAAHAWPEVFFPNYGWVEFEPTAARPGLDDQSAPTTPAAAASRPQPSIRKAAQTAAAALVILAAAAGLLFLASRWRIPSRSIPADSDAEQLYWRTRRWLSRADISAGSDITPRAFLAASVLQLSPYPRLQALLETVTRLHEQMLFCPVPPSAAAIRSGRQQARSAWRDWLRLFVHSAMHRLQRALKIHPKLEKSNEALHR